MTATDYKRNLIVWVTVHEASGRAIVTGPKGGIWERLALEAGAKVWNREWYGWTLETPSQLADLCCLADIYGAIYNERQWTPELLGRLKAKRRHK